MIARSMRMAIAGATARRGDSFIEIDLDSGWMRSEVGLWIDRSTEVLAVGRA